MGRATLKGSPLLSLTEENNVSWGLMAQDESINPHQLHSKQWTVEGHHGSACFMQCEPVGSQGF